MIDAFRHDMEVEPNEHTVEILMVSAGGIYTAVRLTPEKAEQVAERIRDAARAARAEAVPIEQEQLAP